jgi:3-methyl-2-oxobutanoate hydroxymethyltransferase
MERKKVTVTEVQRRKDFKEKITLLTAYDYPTASFCDKAEIDIILVSDAVGTVGMGRDNGFSVTVDEMIYHTQAVRRGAGACLVVTSMPFGSYSTLEEAIHNAKRLVKEGGSDAVHIEGGQEIKDSIAAIVMNGVSVLAHVGLNKLIIARTGETRVQAANASQAARVIQDAIEVYHAGAFAMMLECVPDRVADIITQSIPIPVIGIGAGVNCDGQALVTNDMLGIFPNFSPRFVKRYANIEDVMVKALTEFRNDVHNSRFPMDSNSYHIKDSELNELIDRLSRI